MRKLFATLLSVAVLLALALPAAALGTDGTVTMAAEGDRAAVTLTLPAQQAEGITSLSLSFDVQTGEEADVQFDFDDGLQSSVQQARYNASAGRLTIYVSGRQTLFTDGTVTLGEICLSGPDALTATVSLEGDALRVADGAYGAPETVSLSAQSVQLAVGGTPDQGGGDEDDGDQNNGGQTGGDQNNGGQTGGDQNNGSQTGGDQNNDGQTGGSQNNGGQTGGDQNNGGQTGGDQNNGSQNNGGQTGGDQNNGSQTGGDQSNGGQNLAAGDETQGKTDQNETSPDTGDHSLQSELQQQSAPERQGSPWLTVALVAAGVLAAAAVLVVLLLRRHRWED